MAKVAGTLFRHRERLNEMVTVVARQGLAAGPRVRERSRPPVRSTRR